MTSPQNPNDDPQRMGRGATTVRYAVARYLKTSYPAMRQRALNQWRIRAEELPSIEAFSPIDVIEIAPETKPVVGVEVRNATNLRNTDVNDFGSREYQVNYDVRISVYLVSRQTADGRDLAEVSMRGDAIRQRDDQMAVIRACMLDRQSLGTDFLTARQDNITVNYPMPTPVNNNSGRWAAAGELAIEVRADEWNTVTALGELGEQGVDLRVDLSKAGNDPFPYLDLIR